MEQEHLARAGLYGLLGPRWVEIEVTALENNLREVKKILRPFTRLLAVVKADAYGAGAVEAARVFCQAGADYLGVTTLAEGVELRRQGITIPILVMSPLLPEEIPQALAWGLTLAVASRWGAEAVAQAVRETGRLARIHLKIESGMYRAGLEPEEVKALIRDILSWPGVVVEGAYTHLAQAAHSRKAWEQFRLFFRVCQELEEEGLKIPLKHIANSYACLAYPEMHLDMVRVGTLLYGHYPAGTIHQEIKLQDPWKVKARLLHIREVPAGTAVGYGGDYVTKRATRLGVLPLGYADGLGLTAITRPKSWPDLLRFLAKTFLAYWGWQHREEAVLVRGRPVPIIGRVGMQLSLVDLGDIPAQEGEEVEISLGRPFTSARLPRLYLREGEPYLLRLPTGEWRGLKDKAGFRAR
ncbi:alanine racemase [Thermanaeromonas toyohensis ToBE]|uniref:Alanine racemase n=1 Tax=Thermanaeromonas toyohensis ToBE TaxID=698762 RepID=A0A1W1W3C4_9FIRM|nr:alanine racemase [Thermanaeromonas toyohensis]SMC00129.1 alanine racemase [Thermanaeromonas toyohensis ToBE]